LRHKKTPLPISPAGDKKNNASFNSKIKEGCVPYYKDRSFLNELKKILNT